MILWLYTAIALVSIDLVVVLHLWIKDARQRRATKEPEVYFVPFIVPTPEEQNAYKMDEL
jgi:hypothetical protein